MPIAKADSTAFMHEALQPLIMLQTTDVSDIKNAWEDLKSKVEVFDDASYNAFLKASETWKKVVDALLTARTINTFQTGLAFLEAALTTVLLTSAAREHPRETHELIMHLIAWCLPCLNPNPAVRMHDPEPLLARVKATPASILDALANEKIETEYM